MTHIMGEQNVRLFLKPNPDVNERLRAATRYQGDLSEYIAEALVSVDLSMVALDAQKVSRTDPALTAVISADASGALRTAASTRKCPITVLANTAIRVWLDERIGSLRSDVDGWLSG
jgi:hypothetical protein